MIKLTFVIRRRPGLDEAKLRRYWREQHSQLVATHAETLRIRRGLAASAALLEDEARYIDLPACRTWFNEEHEIVAGSARR